MSWSSLSIAERDVLTAIYNNSKRTVDDLPYTPEFEKMRSEFNAKTGRGLNEHDFWRAISSARKTGNLSRKKR